MDKRQLRMADAFDRILLFLKDHELEAPPPLLVEKRRELAEIAVQLNALGAFQAGAKRSSRSAEVKVLRNHLRQEVLMPLMLVVKPLITFAPGSERLFRIPHARASHGAIAAHAMAVAAGLRPYEDLLRSAGYADSFLDELHAKGETLARTNAEAEAFRHQVSHATLDVGRAIERAMAAISVIEGIVLTQIIRGNPAVATRWRTARRIRARQGRPPQGPRRAPAGEAPVS